MSVIAGICLSEEATIASEDRDSLLRRMQRYAADRTGIWQDGPILMICRHQWITPEARTEDLPRFDSGRELAICADAILDNREELFDRLAVPPGRRVETTDSELILLAYERWGREAPAYLIGDFAFVVWDKRKRTLFGARDPLGNRTLYWTERPGRFAFCTAIGPLMALPGVAQRIDEAWLAEYLAIPSMLDAAGPFSTVRQAVRQLPPGHRLILPAFGQVQCARYERLKTVEKLRYRTDGEYVESFREVFREAVRAKIRTYREVGASLSGGLDSGAVAGYAARALESEGKVLHAYSFVPPEDFVDWTAGGYVANERPFIEATVRHVRNLDGHFLDMGEGNPYADIDELLAIREMPYKTFENSYWVKAMYARAEEQGAGVLLTGAQGNHTISWGPALDYYARLLKRLRWIKLYRELLLYSRKMRIRRSRLFPIVGREAAVSLLPGALAGFEPPFPAMIHPDFAAKTRVLARLAPEEAGLAPGKGTVWNEREIHFGSEPILNLIGTSAAKFSLRFGLWERDPTADLRVVRFCLALPPEQYVQNGLDRALVRRASADELPDSIRLNQRYRGIQGADWVFRMRRIWPVFLAELRAMCKDSLVEGVLNIPQAIASMTRIGEEPRPELALDDDARFLMRCLIVYRFLKMAS